jgi:putative protease
MPIKKKNSTKKKPIKKPAGEIIKKPAKKTLIKKPLKKKAAPKAGKPVLKPKKSKEGLLIGKVTHYFPKVSAAVIKLKAPLSAGDSIKIKGQHTDFTQKVESIQIDRAPITTGKKGDEIGLLVVSRVREHDVVYKI